MNIGTVMPSLQIQTTGNAAIDREMQNAITQLFRDKGVFDWDLIVSQAYVLASSNQARQNPALASRIFHRWEQNIKKVFAIVPRVRQIEARAQCRHMMINTTQFDTMWETLIA
jgi:hypothetical protein